MEDDNIGRKEVETTGKIIQRDRCDPTNCEKLFHPRQRSSKWCPVSDPTPSTCAFLLRVKQCCNMRNCQLASKICDLYAPLYKIEEPLTDGDPQYHYLLKDANTQVEPLEVLPLIEIIEEPPPTPVIEELPPEPVIEEEVIEVIPIEEEPKSDESVEIPEPSPLQKISEEEISATAILLTPPPVDENAVVPSEDDFQDAPAADTRTSVVSWDVRASRAVRGSAGSQEQVINRAKQEVNQLRMKGKDQHALFGKNARQNLLGKSKERLPSDDMSEEFLKSQLQTVSLHDSTHNQKCCASLRKKCKRKKKQEFDRDDSITWRAAEGQEKRKPKMSSSPVQEKKQQINTMLSKM